jgi:hypothetical protein
MYINHIVTQPKEEWGLPEYLSSLAVINVFFKLLEFLKINSLDVQNLRTMPMFCGV